jgi:hypothetical protein
MRGEVRTVNSMACAVWMRRSWKGAICGQGPWRPSRVSSIRSLLRRLVMEKTAHVLLVGQSASRFADYFGLERAPRAKSNGRRPTSAIATAHRGQSHVALAPGDGEHGPSSGEESGEGNGGGGGAGSVGHRRCGGFDRRCRCHVARPGGRYALDRLRCLRRQRRRCRLDDGIRERASSVWPWPRRSPIVLPPA